MRLSLKILAFLWLGLLLIISALLFNAYSKLKPDTFINLISQQVQSNYPGSKLKVGNISYGFSLDFNLHLQNVEVRRNDKVLADIGEIEFRIPWWLLLANRGNAQINLRQLNIFVDHDDELVTKQKLESQKALKLKIKLPAYLSDARYTLRAMDVSISDIETGRRYFVISKLLVREFNVHKNSAFELHVPITIKNKNAQYVSDLWLFGDITPDIKEWNLNFRGEFRTKENNEKFQIEDLVIGGTAKFNPSEIKIISDLDLLIDKRNVGSGNIILDNGNIYLKINISDLPINFLSFIYEEIKNPYLVNPQGEASGSIKFHKNFETSVASISGNLNFNGLMHLSETSSISGTWKVGLQNSRWEISFIAPKGEASFFRRSVIDPVNNTINQYYEEIGFSSLDLNNLSESIMPIGNFISNNHSYFTTTLSYKNCFTGNQVFNGEFKYGVTPEQRFYKGSWLSDKSSLVINYVNKQQGNNFELNLSNFNWNPNYRFLTPFFNSKSGVLDGKISGRWSEKWEQGQWSFKLSGKDVVDSDGKFSNFLNQTLSFFEISPKNFNKQTINIISKDGLLRLNTIFFENSEDIKISGLLGINQKSFLNLYSSKNKKVIKKEVPQKYWFSEEAI